MFRNFLRTSGKIGDFIITRLLWKGQRGFDPRNSHVLHVPQNTKRHTLKDSPTAHKSDDHDCELHTFERS